MKIVPREEKELQKTKPFIIRMLLFISKLLLFIIPFTFITGVLLFAIDIWFYPSNTSAEYTISEEHEPNKNTTYTYTLNEEEKAIISKYDGKDQEALENTLAEINTYFDTLKKSTPELAEEINSVSSTAKLIYKGSGDKLLNWFTDNDNRDEYGDYLEQLIKEKMFPNKDETLNIEEIIIFDIKQFIRKLETTLKYNKNNMLLELNNNLINQSSIIDLQLSYDSQILNDHVLSAKSSAQKSIANNAMSFVSTGPFVIQLAVGYVVEKKTKDSIIQDFNSQIDALEDNILNGDGEINGLTRELNNSLETYIYNKHESIDNCLKNFSEGSS